MQHKRFFSRDPLHVTERILAAAESEFAAEGFTGASTNRIARHFGGSKATLFRYYSTKAELFVAVMRRISERRVAKIDWDALDRDNPIVGLTEFASSALESSVSSDSLFVGRMVVAHGQEFPALRSAFTAMAITPVLDGLADFLRDCNLKGVLHCTDCDADAIRFFDLAVGGWTARALLGGLPDQSKAFLNAQAAESAALFLEGRSTAFAASDKRVALNG
jgi:AcrR family transcriptional regulator